LKVPGEAKALYLPDKMVLSMVRSLRGELFSILFLLLMVLSSGQASAAAIHDGWHFTGDTFTVEGSVFLVTHFDLNYPNVILKVDDVSYIIRNGTCKYTATREYCVQQIYTDTNESTHIKFEDGKAYAGIHVVVNAVGADISVTRTFSTVTPKLGEEVTETVTIKNTGKFYPDSFTYTESFPRGVFLTSSSSGAKRDGNSLSFNLNMQPGTSINLFYSFKLVDFINYSSEPKWSYSYAGSSASFNISAQKIAVSTPKPYTFAATLTPGSVEVLADSAFLINLDDSTEDDLSVESVDVRLSSPELSFYPGESSLSKSGTGVYSWSGQLKGGSGKSLKAKVRASQPGDYYLMISVILKDIDGNTFTESKNLSFKTTFTEIEPTLSVKKDSVSEGGSFRVAFSLRNPNKKTVFSDIAASVNSALFPSFETTLGSLEVEQVKDLLIKDDFIAPSIDQKQVFEINATGTYETSFGEKRNFTKKSSITITPVTDVIVLTQAINRLALKTGDNLTVTVKVKNNNQEAIVVDVKDVFTDGVEILGGKVQDTLYFDKSGEQQAYVYSLVIPPSFTGNELLVTSTASIQGKDYMVTREQRIPVNVTFTVVKVNATPEIKPVAPLIIETPVIEEPGIIGKIIGGVENLVSGLVDSVSGFFSGLFKSE
jgi:hypothetical protein